MGLRTYQFLALRRVTNCGPVDRRRNAEEIWSEDKIQEGLDGCKKNKHLR